MIPVCRLRDRSSSTLEETVINHPRLWSKKPTCQRLAGIQLPCYLLDAQPLDKSLRTAYESLSYIAA